MAASSTVTAKNGWMERFWPGLITNEGEINHTGMIRRMETFLGLMIPGAGTFYTVLRCCGCPHSEFITLMCAIPVPTLFSHLDEYRAETAFAKVESVRKEQLPASQAPAQPVMAASPKSILKSSGSLGKTPVLPNGSTVQRRVAITSDRSEQADGYPMHALAGLKYSQS